MLSHFDKILAQNLFEAFPEFRSYAEHNVFKEFYDSSYTLFGPFGGMVCEEILNKSNPDFVFRAFEYINELASQQNYEVDQMLAVTFMERLMDKRSTIDAALAHLRGQALQIFNKVRNGPIFQGGPKE